MCGVYGCKGASRRQRDYLTSSHWMPYKPTNFCWHGRSVSVYTRIPIFVFCRKTCNHATHGVPSWRLTCIHAMACHHDDWHVYTPSFLGAPGVTVGWPRTKGTASNERVHSFCGFLSNHLYPRHVPLTYQPRICKDGFISIVFDVSPVCRLSDRALVDNRPLLRSLPTV